MGMATRNPRGDAQLMDVLDYILNSAGLREIDALSAAVERRRKDLASLSGMNTLDPQRFARGMAEAVQESIDGSMEGMRRSFRQFAADLIRKEAPELSEEQMAELVEAWIPDRPTRPGARGKAGDSSDLPPAPQFRGADASGAVGGGSRPAGLARKGLVNGIPAEAMLEMARQFVAYSAGRMTLADESALRDAVSDWTALYWKKFPEPLRGLIRDYLAGGFPEEAFERELGSLLS